MNKGLRWKETIAGVEAPNLMVVETQLPAGRNQTFATPADIVACLKANPEAAGQVLLALESQYIAGETAKHIARASQAESDRDMWRAKWEALETTRASCCDQMERERDEARATNRDNLAMWEVERDALKAKLAEAERENLTLRNRIGIDRTSWHEAEAEVKVLRAKLAKTERERDDAMALAEERRDYARAQNAKLSVENDSLRARLAKTERVVEATRREHGCELLERGRGACAICDALRALDEDSGGSGAASDGSATRKDAGEAPAGVALPSPAQPEPAGSSRRCGACLGCGILPSEAGEYCHAPCRECGGSGLVSLSLPQPDPQAPATRAEVEELRRQVERLEGLTGFGPEE